MMFKDPGKQFNNSLLRLPFKLCPRDGHKEFQAWGLMPQHVEGDDDILIRSCEVMCLKAHLMSFVNEICHTLLEYGGDNDHYHVHLSIFLIHFMLFRVTEKASIYPCCDEGRHDTYPEQRQLRQKHARSGIIWTFVNS